jgi:hypothetical protein
LCSDWRYNFSHRHTDPPAQALGIMRGDKRMTRLVRIPTVFYDDHTSGRELPAPPIVSATLRHYVIDADHADAAELLSDAKHYSDVVEWAGDRDYLGLQSSARATVGALKAACA